MLQYYVLDTEPIFSDLIIPILKLAAKVLLLGSPGVQLADASASLASLLTLIKFLMWLSATPFHNQQPICRQYAQFTMGNLHITYLSKVTSSG